MRSWLAVSLMLLLLSPRLFAQRGGGHGGGHAGGFSGSRGFGGGSGFSGGMGSGHGMSFVAPRQSFTSNLGPQSRMSYPSRSFSTYPRASYPAARSAFGQMNPQGVKRGPYPGAGRSQGRSAYRRPYFYARNTYLTPGLLNYWPYFGDWGSSDQSASYGQADIDTGGQDEAYAPQADQQGWEPSPGYPPASSSGPGPTSEPAVTLVFKDGHSQQVHNYAATRTTLLLLDDASSGRTAQVSLDEIDVAATERVNREAGVDFSLPTAN